LIIIIVYCFGANKTSLLANICRININKRRSLDTERLLYGSIAEVADTKPVVGGHANTVRGVGYQPAEHHVVGPGTSRGSATPVLDRP